MDDAELVAAYLAGDDDAFAQIYDRYADRVHDFCHSVLRDRAEAADAMQDTFVIAARRVGQLRDTTKLRSWLFAIARNEAFRRARKQARTIPTDEERFRHLAAPDDNADAGMSGDDAREVVWAAAAGLNERDRMLLDLHLRQGLDGQELADAIGVSASHAYVMMNRLRVQMERALGALLIARLGRDDCDDLGAILQGWDGTFSTLVRKRVARHVEQCEQCDERRRALVAPLAAFAAIPALPAAAASRSIVLDRVRHLDAPSRGATGDELEPIDNADADSFTWGADGFPRPPRELHGSSIRRLGARRRVLAAATAAAVVIGGGGSWFAATRDDGRGGGFDVEAEAGASTTIESRAAEPSPTSTTAEPTATSIADSPDPSAPATTAVTPTQPDGSGTTPPAPTSPVVATSTTAAPNDSPPTLSVDASPTEIWTDSQCGPVTSFFTANVDDDHGVVDVSFVWKSKYSGQGTGTFDVDEPSWFGYLGNLSNLGYDDTVMVEVTAKDTIGQRTKASFDLTLKYCLI